MILIRLFTGIVLSALFRLSIPAAQLTWCSCLVDLKIAENVLAHFWMSRIYFEISDSHQLCLWRKNTIADASFVST